MSTSGSRSGRGLVNRTSGERDTNQPQVRDQPEPSLPNATNTFDSGEADCSPFIAALLAARHPLIMEVKRRDPEAADLLGGASIADVVAGYEAAGAPCLSVVTGRWFGGTQEMLAEVAALTDRPVLQKDFITRREQVAKASSLGASAVLLTARLLPKASVANLVDACLAAGLTPFVEVTSEAEIATVPHASHCVIAVNNKDITNRERGPADIDRSVRLLPALARSGTRCPVSASGIDHPQVAAGLLDAGYAGLLVGTALLRTDPRVYLSELDGHRRRAAG